MRIELVQPAKGTAESAVDVKKMRGFMIKPYHRSSSIERVDVEKKAKIKKSEKVSNVQWPTCAAEGEKRLFLSWLFACKSAFEKSTLNGGEQQMIGPARRPRFLSDGLMRKQRCLMISAVGRATAYDELLGTLLFLKDRTRIASCSPRCCTVAAGDRLYRWTGALSIKGTVSGSFILVLVCALFPRAVPRKRRRRFCPVPENRRPCGHIQAVIGK